MMVLALYDYDNMLGGSKDINLWERDICSRPQVFDWDQNDIARRKYTLREFSLNRPAPKTLKEEYNHVVVGTEVQIKHRAWLRHEITDALEIIGLVGVRWTPPSQLGSGEWLCNAFRLTTN